MGELHSKLGIDWGPLAAHLKMLDERAYQSASEVEQRVARAQAKIRASQADVRSLEQAIERGSLRVAKSLGKAAAVSIAGAAVSEIGIPEATRPLVNIGIGAFQGAQFAGAQGAVIGAGVAAAMEAMKYAKFIEERVEKYRTHILNFQREQEEINREVQADFADGRRALEQMIEKTEREVDLEFYKGFHDTLRAIAKDAD